MEGGIQIEHAIPGRIRLKVPQLKDNSALAKTMEDVIRDAVHPEKLRFNLTIGSLVVEFDPKMPNIFEKFAQLIDAFMPEESAQKEQLKRHLSELRQTGHVRGATPGVASAGAAALGNLKQEIRAASRGITDLKTLAPFILLGLGAGALMMADPVTFPAWHDYFWYAFATYAAFYGVSKVVA